MENNFSKDSSVAQLLEEVFYFNKERNEYKVLRNSTNIPLLYHKLHSQSTTMEDKLLLVKSLKLNCECIRHYASVFSKHFITTEANESLGLSLVLLREYIEHSDKDTEDKSTAQEATQQYLTTTLALLRLLISNVSSPIEVFDYVYSLFRPYLYLTQSPSTKVLTPQRFQRYFALLSLVYGAKIAPLAPYEYMYFSGTGEISLYLGLTDTNPKQLVTYQKEFAIYIWFKPSIRKEDSTTHLTDDIDLINILQRDNTFTKVSLDPSNTLKSTTDPDLSVPLKENEWNFLVFSWYKSTQGLNAEIYLNHKGISSQLFNPTQNPIHLICLFTRFIGEVSSVLFTEGSLLKDLLPLLAEKQFRYGINTERDFISLQKTLNSKPLFNYQSRLIQESKSYSFSTSSMEGIQLIYMPSRSKEERPTEVTLFDASLDGKIIQSNSYSSGVNLFKPNYKLIAQHHALYPLLPIMELLLLSTKSVPSYPQLTNCLTDDSLNDYFALLIEVKSYFNDPKYVKEMINFIQFTSLFLEKAPKELFTFKLFEKFHTLLSGNDFRVESPPLSLTEQIVDKVLLNEKIYFKFPLVIQDALWPILDKHFEHKKIGSSVCMVKIISILLELDKEKETKYCCAYHRDIFLTDDPSSTYDIKERLNYMTIFIDKMLSQKAEEIKVLLSLLSSEISPCLQLYLLSLINDYIEKKAHSPEIIKIIGHLKDDNYLLKLLLFAFSIAVFDVRLEILSLMRTICARGNFFFTQDQIAYIKHHLIPSKIIVQKGVFNKEEGKEEWEKVNVSDAIANSNVSKDVNKGNLKGFRKVELSSNEEYVYRHLNKEKFHKLVDDLGVFLLDWWITSDYPSFIFNWLTSLTPYMTILKNYVLLNSMGNQSNGLDNELCKNKDAFLWLLDITFQVFISQDAKLKSALAFNTPEDKPASHKEAEDFINSALSILARICKRSYGLLDNFMQWCYYYKELYQNDNPYHERLIEFIVKIIEMLSQNIMVLDISHASSESKDEKSYLYFLSVIFEYIIVFKLEKHFTAEKTFFASDSKDLINVPSYYSVLFEEPSDEKRRSVFDRWSNYSLFKVVIDPSIELFKEKISTDAAYIMANYFNSSSTFIVPLTILTMSHYGGLRCEVNDGLPLIVILSNAMAFMVNEMETEGDVNQWLNNYSHFLRYVIVASTNLYQDAKYVYMQDLCRDAIVVGMNVLIKQLAKKKASIAGRVLDVIKELLTIVNAIVQRIHETVIEYNDLSMQIKIFTSIKKFVQNNKSGPKVDCAVFQVFGEIFPFSNFAYIKKALSNEAELRQFLLSDEILRKTLLENALLVPSMEKTFIFKEICEKRRRAITAIVPMYNAQCNLPDNSSSIIRVDTNYIEEIYFLFKSTITEIINQIRKDFNKRYHLYLSKRAFERDRLLRKYRKRKMEMFVFRGIWSDKELFCSKRSQLKYKVLDHITKDYTRPLLYPLLDYEQYLPQFSNFEKKNLFMDKENPQKLIDMDLGFYFTDEGEESQGEQVVSVLEKPSTMLRRIYDSAFEGIITEREELKNKKGKSAEYMLDFIISRMSLSTEKDKLKTETKAPIPCCLMRGAYHIKGYFHNDHNGVGFYAHDWPFDPSLEIYDAERDTCFGSLFKTQIPQKRKYHIFIPYNKMERLFKRRYIFRQIGIEIYTLRRKSFYFLFHLEDTRNVLWDNIENHLKNRAIQIEHTKIEKSIGMENLHCLLRTAKEKNNSKPMVSLYQKMTLWSEWKISTLELIMYVNVLANRSYSDFMQYPVFPWIITDYKSDELPEKAIRNFSQPVGMLDVFPESMNRKTSYQEHFDLMVNENRSKDNGVPYVYGTHYSNAMYVSYYLMRLFPFTQVKLELQGSCFDNPNRLFSALDSSFQCATTQKADVRELVPEFFCLPEVFLNLNGLDFGLAVSLDRKTKTRVEGVIMPKWSGNNAYSFVAFYRRKLESPEVNETIAQWLEIIFGYYQKSPRANEIYNLFLNETYETYEKEFNQLDKKNKDYICRMIEFGVTPHQVLGKVDMRKSLDKLRLSNHFTASSAYIQVNSRQLMFLNFWDKRNHLNAMSPCLKVSEEDRRLIVYTPSKVLVFKYNEEKVKTEESERWISQYLQSYDYNITENGLTVPLSSSYNTSAVFNRGECLVKGGYANGQLFLQYTNEKKESKCVYYLQDDLSSITALSVDQEERFLLCGTEIGLVHIYFINQQEASIDLLLYKTISDHQGAVTAIHMNSRLNVFASASSDGFIMLYTMPQCKLFNIIQLPSAVSISHLFVSSTPLPSVAFYSESDKTWHCYSINGERLIEPIRMEDSVIKAKLFTDVAFIDHIIYSTRGSNLYLASMPKLNMEKYWEKTFSALLDFELTSSKMACIVLDFEDGNYYAKVLQHRNDLASE